MKQIAWIPLLLLAGWGSAEAQIQNDTIADQKINEVVVTARRPTVSVKADKMTYFIDASPSKGTGSLYDTLITLPGVVVNNDGTIYLNGKSGVEVLMDGKQLYLSGQDLVNLLKSTPATTADKIDLITHPSARYDASGNSGLINIQSKKLKLQGINLSFNGNYAQSREGQGGSSLFMNIRKDKFNFYLGYSWYRQGYFNDLYTGRTPLNNPREQAESQSLQQDLYRTRLYNSHYYRGGFDYYLSPRTTIGVSTSGNLFTQRENGDMTNYFHSQEQRPDSALRTFNLDHVQKNNFMAGASLLHKLDTLGKELDLSFDYLRYHYLEDQLMNNLFAADAASYSPRDTIKGDMEGGLHLYTGQFNLNVPVNRTWTLQAGAKFNYVKIENDANYQDRLSGDWVQNQALTSDFRYTENINAGYIQLGLNLAPFTLDAGLRLENTRIGGNLSGNSIQRDTVFKNHYTHLFPTFSLRYALKDNRSLALSYGRRINRPNYRDLNPFVYIYDNYTYEQGNTLLKPELSDNLELAYLHKDLLKAAFLVGLKQDVIVKSYQELEGLRMVVMPENMSSCLSLGGTLNTSNLSLTNFWTLNVNASVIYNRYRLPDNYPLRVNKRTTPSLGLSNQFAFGNGWSADITGMYIGKMAAGQATLHANWKVDAGIRKTIFNGKGTIQLYGRDIFHSWLSEVELQSPGWKAYIHERESSTMVGISFSYRFSKGTGTKESTRKSSIDESKRINL